MIRYPYSQQPRHSDVDDALRVIIKILVLSYLVISTLVALVFGVMVVGVTVAFVILRLVIRLIERIVAKHSGFSLRDELYTLYASARS